MEFSELVSIASTQRLDDKPLLTICCIAYNHSLFIHDSIGGFLSQKTNFPVEIIIHDDASSDGTTDLIKHYHAKYPNLIKVILQEENQFSSRGFEFFSEVLEQAQGKYIALCEGDDYWTDPSKLQRQVDFLEANPDFAICFHKVQIHQDGTLKDDFIANPPRAVSTIEDLAWQNYIHTCSCVFRNRGAEILGPSFGKSPLGDYYLHMMNAQYGKIYCVDAIMAVYRLHNCSVWSSLCENKRISKTIQAIRCILDDLSNEYVNARVNLIDSCIDHALRARDSLAFPIESPSLVLHDSPFYINRLEESLYDAREQLKKLELRLQLSAPNILRRYIKNIYNMPRFLSRLIKRIPRISFMR